MKISRGAALLLLLLSVSATTGLAKLHPTFDPDRECCDHLFYRAMSAPERYSQIPPGNRLTEVYGDPYYARWMDRRNGLDRQPPYLYRPLVPFLARRVGFYALTIAGLAMAAWFLSLAALRLTGRVWVAAIAIALLLGNRWVGALHLFDYQLTDPIAFAFLSLGVFALVSGHDAIVLGTITVGVFAKESAAFLLPCWLLLRALEGRLIWRDPLVAAIACAPYALFRLTRDVPVPTYSLSTTFFHWHPAALMNAAAATFGVVWIPAMLGLGTGVRALLGLLPLLVLSFGAVFFAGNAERTMIYAYPLAVLSTCVVIGRVPPWIRRRLAPGSPALGAAPGALKQDSGTAA